jgi:micrococcal nuclease
VDQHDGAKLPPAALVRRFRRSPLGGVLLAVGIAALVALRSCRSDDPAPSPASARTTSAQGSAGTAEASVLRVVDGDTLVLADRTRLRLIGVNAPESVKPDWPVEPFGLEASRFARQFIGRGRVRLEFDKERLDQHGRTLAYVWVGQRMLNEELLREGLARWERNYRYSAAMKRRFAAAQREAESAGRGIWSLPPEKRWWQRGR